MGVVRLTADFIHEMRHLGLSTGCVSLWLPPAVTAAVVVYRGSYSAENSDSLVETP